MENSTVDYGKGMLTRLLGKRREQKEKRRPLEVTEDSTAWDVYNDQADLLDRERIRDWNESLNTLLIFAALYSAVLTAFIVESMKLIQEDSTDTMRDILFTISRQIANNSTPSFEPTPFVAPMWAIRVNYCFFVSIACSLVTALSAVLALQWVASYDRGLNPSSPKEKALQRHFRTRGVNKWKMDHIITALPAVIFIALFIFFCGMADWLWHIDHGLAAIAIVGIAVGSLFYWGTTALSMLLVGAPFRTPVSIAMLSFLGRMRQLCKAILRRLGQLLASLRSSIQQISKIKLENVRQLPSKLLQKFKAGWQSARTRVATWLSSIQRFVHERHNRSPSPPLSQPVTPSHIRSQSQSQLLLSPPSGRANVFRYLNEIFHAESFEVRERQAVDRELEQGLDRDSLLWIARSISVSSYQLPAILVVIREITNSMQAKPWERSDEKINHAAWTSIFTLLYAPYKVKVEKEKSADEMQDALFLLQSFSSIGQVVFPPSRFEALFSEFYEGCPEVEQMHQLLVDWRRLELDGSDTEFRQATVLASYQRAIEHWAKWPSEFLMLLLHKVKEDGSKKAGPKHTRLSMQELLEPIRNGLVIPNGELKTAKLESLQILDAIFEVIVTEYRLPTPPNATGFTPPTPVVTSPAPAPISTQPSSPLRPTMAPPPSLPVVPAIPTQIQRPVDRYLYCLRRTPYANLDETVVHTHTAILNQFCARLVQFGGPTDINNAIATETLQRIISLVSYPWKDMSKMISMTFLSMMSRTRSNLWSLELRETTAKALTLVFGQPDGLMGINGFMWSAWWQKVIVGFANTLSNNPEEFKKVVYPCVSQVLSRMVQTNLPENPAAISSLWTKRVALATPQIHPKPAVLGVSQLAVTTLSIKDLGASITIATLTRSGDLARAATRHRGKLQIADHWADWVSNLYNDLGDAPPTSLTLYSQTANLRVMTGLILLGMPKFLATAPKLISFLNNTLFYDGGQFLQSPTLYMMLGSESHDMLSLLPRISRNSWFSTYFLAADGPILLPLFAQRGAKNFVLALTITKGALDGFPTYEATNAWLLCARDCLIAGGMNSDGNILSNPDCLKIRTELRTTLKLKKRSWPNKPPPMHPGPLPTTAIATAPPRPAAANTPVSPTPAAKLPVSTAAPAPRPLANPTPSALPASTPVRKPDGPIISPQSSPFASMTKEARHALVEELHMGLSRGFVTTSPPLYRSRPSRDVDGRCLR